MRYILEQDNLEIVGKQYLKDVGGYDGTNAYDGKDVATILQNIQSDLNKKNYPIINRSDIDATIKPNVYNIWNVNTYPTTITLETPTYNDIVNEYVIRFSIPNTTVNHSLVFSSEIKWVDNNVPTWESGCTYEISIIDGYAVFLNYYS